MGIRIKLTYSDPDKMATNFLAIFSKAFSWMVQIMTWPKETSKLRDNGLCEGNSPLTSEFPVQWASNAGNVSIWWHPHSHNAGLNKRAPIIKTTLSDTFLTKHCLSYSSFNVVCGIHDVPSDRFITISDGIDGDRECISDCTCDIIVQATIKQASGNG